MSAPVDAVPHEEGTTDVQWATESMGDASYRRLLRILFGPRNEDSPRPADGAGGGQR